MRPFEGSPATRVHLSIALMGVMGCGAPLDIAQPTGAGATLRFRVTSAEFVDTRRASVALITAREAQFLGLVPSDFDDDSRRLVAVVARVPATFEGDCIVPSTCQVDIGWATAFSRVDFESASGTIQVSRVARTQFRIGAALTVEFLDASGSRTARTIRLGATDALVNEGLREHLLSITSPESSIRAWLEE